MYNDFNHLFLIYSHAQHYPTNTFHTSPLSHFPWLRHARSHNLVAIEQTQRIERLLELPHSVHGTFTQFMWQIISFDEPNTMLARCRALELNGALDHVVHEVLSFIVVRVLVVEDDGYIVISVLDFAGNDSTTYSGSFHLPRVRQYSPTIHF